MKVRFLLFILFACAVLLFTTLTNLFKIKVVQDNSMAPVYKRGQWVIVSNQKKINYNAVCLIKNIDKKPSVLRVTGLEGDTLEFSDGYLLRNGFMADNPGNIYFNYYAWSQKFSYEENFKILNFKPYQKGDSLIFCLNYNEYKGISRMYFLHRLEHENLENATIVVPKDHCFVLGDNRDVAVDSRKLGCIPVKNVIPLVWD